MNRTLKTLVLVGLLVLNPILAAADLFDDAVAALSNDNLEAASLDNLGQSLRGGLTAGYPQYTPGPTPLHGFEISTPCGSFSLGQGFMDQLEGMLDPSSMLGAVQQTATSLLGALVSQLPMIGVCYAWPTGCDIIKYLQSFINDMLQFQGLSCSQAEAMLTGLGGKLRKQVETKCVQRKMAGGMTVEKAQKRCAANATQMRQGITDHATGKPVHQGDGSSKLIEDTLTRAGADQEIKDFANDLLGEVEIKGGGDAGIDVDIQAPKKRLHDEYEKERGEIFNEIYESANIVGGGNQLSADKRKLVSLPGMAMPDAVLRAIYDIGQNDPAAYNDYMGKLASNIALVKLSWKVNQTRDELEDGAINNPDLDEAEQEILKLRLARLMRESERFIREKETAERHVLPVMREVLAHRQEQLNKMAGAALIADSDTSQQANRFGLQNPLGYGY